MTQASNVLVVGEAANKPFALMLSQRILRAVRPTATSQCAVIEEVDGDSIAEADAVILVVGANDGGEWRSLARLCDEQDVPALAITSGGDGPPTATLCFSDTAPVEHVAAALEAALHQQRVVKRLRGELAVAQRFQGGLRGEINRMHDELQLAAMVQQEFLPRTLPALHGVSFAALWRPANYVAGDIYDITRLDHDHVGVFLADAVGHGVPAALLTMVIARGLPTKDISGSNYRLVPPGEALQRLNEEMIRRQGDATRFATAVYAVINCRTREVRLAAAGHPAPLLVREGALAGTLETSGGLLGVFEDERFEEVSFELTPGDRVLLYSDGFELAFPGAHEPDSAARLPSKAYLGEFEAAAAAESPHDLVQSLHARLDAQPGSLHQKDDVTLIVLHAGAPASIQSEQSGPIIERMQIGEIRRSAA
jgi:sigma-B regulation protein RsbU (phosphoserine phosphatase)